MAVERALNSGSPEACGNPLAARAGGVCATVPATEIRVAQTSASAGAASARAAPAAAVRVGLRAQARACPRAAPPPPAIRRTQPVLGRPRPRMASGPGRPCRHIGKAPPDSLPGAPSLVHRGPGGILPDRVGIVGLCRWGAPLVEGWGPAVIADRRRPRSASPSAVGTTKGSGVGFEASGVEPQPHQRSGEAEASDRGVAREAVRAAGRDLRGLAGASRRTGPSHHTLRPADSSWPAGPGPGRGEAAVRFSGKAGRFVTAPLPVPPGSGR